MQYFIRTIKIVRMIQIGERIKAFRGDMARAELARKTGLSTDYLWKLEKGLIKNPTIDTLRKIAKALGVEAADLIRKEEVA